MSTATPPEPLQSNTVEARLIRQKVWEQCNTENQHFMAATVGREGSGKSHTSLKIGQCSDPTFSADRVMFKPAAFLKRLQKWKEQGETRGKLVVADEAGVGLGVRTWHEKDQVKFNQVLQVIRDENMGILFTLPRLSELDSQARGRLHALIEMTDLEAGEWAECKWKNMDPDRGDESGKIYKKYPRMRVNGHERRITRLKFSPPPEDLVKAYEQRKNEFQDELYQEAIEAIEGDEEVSKTPKELAEDIANGGLSKIVSEHGQTGEPYISKDLIRGHYELSHRDAKTVKSLLDQRFNAEAIA